MIFFKKKQEFLEGSNYTRCSVTIIYNNFSMQKVKSERIMTKHVKGNVRKFSKVANLGPQNSSVMGPQGSCVSNLDWQVLQNLKLCNLAPKILHS